MSVWDEKRVEACLNKLVGFLKIENHIIRCHPKNPRAGADVAARYKKEIYPEIISDVVDTVKNKSICGDAIDENVIKREIISRLNTELVRLGVAMIPSSGE